MTVTNYRGETYLRKVVVAHQRPADAMLAVSEVDGEAWATNRYWLVPACLLRPMFDKYNLEPTPGIYDVQGGLSKRSDDAPRVASILGGAFDVKAAPASFEGAPSPLFFDGSGGRAAELWDCEGTFRGIDREYRTWVETFTPAGVWMASASGTFARLVDDKVEAVVMSVRCSR